MRPPGFDDDNTPQPDPRPQPRPAVRRVRLAFDPAVSMTEVVGTLELARLAAESIHGVERVVLEAAWSIDRDARTVAIDTTTRAGRTLALVFLGYVRREFGGRAVQVARGTGVAQ